TRSYGDWSSDVCSSDLKFRALVVEARSNFRDFFGDLIAFCGAIILKTLHLPIQVLLLSYRRDPCIQGNAPGDRSDLFGITHNDHARWSLVGIQLPCLIPTPGGLVRNALLFRILT